MAAFGIVMKTMHLHGTLMKRFLVTFAVVLLLASPLLAQRRHDTAARRAAAAPDPQPALTFDTLIPANSYKVYLEIRNVGQLIHSPAVNDIFDPAAKLIGGNELKPIMKWLRDHADAVAGSRLLVAAWASRQEVPQALVAIEFASPEEAKKFEPQLRGFIPTLMGEPRSLAANSVDANAKRSSLNVNVIGSLILLSEKPFSLQVLRPRKAKLLVEDPNFVVARNRFAAESLFLYIDSESIEKEEEAAQAQRRKWEEEEEQKRIEEQAQKAQPEPSVEMDSSRVDEEPVATPEVIAAANVADTQDAAGTTQTMTPANSQDVQALNSLSTAVYSALFSGQSTWPDAIAVAANFEEDAYVVRALIFGANGGGILPLPFLPHFISGPPLAPQASTVLPGDSTLFVSASLDIPQIYEALNKTILMRAGPGLNASQTVNTSGTASLLADYEKKLGMKIRDDVLPMFGNEVALAFVPKPAESSNSTSSDAAPPKTKEPDPDPIMVLSVRDKEGVRRLLPKLLDAFGFKGASALAQTERKGDTEIVTYANLFAYAFVGDYLILAASPDVTRRAVTAYLDGETLAGNNHFKNARRWQAREVLAQIFVSPTLVQKYGFGVRADNVSADLAAQMALLEPVSYSVSSEGPGPLHELHVPKSLVSLMLSSALNEANNRSLSANEAATETSLRILVSAEETYRATVGDGSYGTLEQLMKEKLISDDVSQRYGYRLELTVSTNKFEATAVPIEYEKTGKRSFFIDETATLRAGDHGGGAATIADAPVN